LNFRQFFGTTFVPYTIFTFIFYTFIPVLVENVLFTYVAQNGDFVPNIVYRAFYDMFIWTFPILPKLPWIFEAILSTILPFFLLLYIRYLVSKKDKNFIYMNIEEENPRGLLPFTVFLVFAIWFTLGAFPIKPIGVATASMYPAIEVGDIIIIKTVKPTTLKEGDIIAYKYNDTTVVHRIKNINKKENQDFVFVTKGDNNYFEDTKPVSQGQVVGKVLFRVKHVAYPTIWLHSLYTEREDVGVETGKDID
jgi:signal peptidase